MAVLLLLLCLGCMVSPAFSAGCTAGCVAEFKKCVGLTNYGFCENEIKKDAIPMKNAGCTPSCTFTKEMEDLDGTGGPGGGSQACSPGGASESTLATGCYELDGRSYGVNVPSGAGPFPVIIALHGNGGTHSSMMKLKDMIGDHILVAPDGPSKSWNIVSEASNEDDAKYVGTTLLAHLATASNVKPSFIIVGSSNGAALTNRILIENDDPRIIGGMTDVSQLNTYQYHDSSFYIGGNNNDYTVPKASLTKRFLLQCTGENDDVIPAAGGESKIPAKLGKLTMLPWGESAYRYAQAYGFTGSEATPENTADYAKVSYLSGRVEAANWFSKGHSALWMNGASEQAMIQNFLTKAAAADSGSPSPSPSPSGTSSTPGVTSGGFDAAGECGGPFLAVLVTMLSLVIYCF